ncbi:TolC family protein [Skermanella pratensis]|uniref:TolC family protein n=1 Tax=Skermanella pratensis TaxID=2233999 RepID=UPI001787F8F7|nr:TolC family protein [Skermanella pratensis]
MPALLPFTLAVPANAQAEAESGAIDPVAMVRLASSGSAIGVRRLLDSLAPREITLEIVADTLLRENFGLLAAREAINAAGTQITQKEAAFDLNLVGSVGLSVSRTADRIEVIGRPRTADTDLTRDDDGDGIPDFVQGNRGTVEEVDGEKVPCVFEDDELINGGIGPGLCGQVPQYSEREEAANLKGPPTKRLTTTLGVSKVFAFGAQGSLSFSSIFNSKAGAQAPPLTRPISATDPFGWGDKLFWTSSASLSATMPLPYTKGFGKTGSPENFGVEAARSGSRRAVFAEQAARNATLAEAVQLYWDMIRSLQDIRILNEQKRVLDHRRTRIERLIGSGTVTNYELGQIQQELASFALREEAAWTQYLLRSNSLLTLMSADPDLVLIPADAEALLAEAVPEPPTDAYDRALVGNPEIMAAQEDLELAKLSLAFRDNQAAPDIDLVLTAQLTQSDIAFGFGNPADSFMNLTKPDKTNIFIGVRYLYPLGNQAARAAQSRARIDERNAFDRARQAKQKIVNSVDRALADIRGAEALMLVSRGDKELADFAYERIVDERERGLATEFEVVNRYQDVLTARLNEANARVEMHKAWIRLSAAQGTLEEDLLR